MNKYKIELWVFYKIIDVFETDDFEIAKNKYNDWFEDYDNNCNKGHTTFYINNELKSIEWMHENLLRL